MPLSPVRTRGLTLTGVLALALVAGCSGGTTEQAGTAGATGGATAAATPGSSSTKAPTSTRSRAPKAAAPATTGTGQSGETSRDGAARDPLTAPNAVLKPLGWRSGAFSGESIAEHKEFGTWRGRPLGTALWFMAQESWAAIQNPAYFAVETLKDPSITPVLSYALWPAGLKGASLARGASGAYDMEWAKLGRVLVQQGLGKAIIRPGWEFNGDWYAWSLRDEQGAADFAAYWRHLVDAMRSVPGQQFEFSWNPVASGGGVDPAKAYPGDAWVDDIGLDVYNVKPKADLSGAALWKAQVDQKYGLAWQKAFAAAHGKKVSYPEWGAFARPDDPALAGGDDPYFLQLMFAWMKANPPSYENYFDYDTPQGTHYGLHTSTLVMPQSAATYKRLWGR